MKTVSTLALAAALSLGLAATPAMAQKKKDPEPAAPTLKVSKAFREPAAAAENAIRANDWATADTQLALDEADAVNED